MPTTMFSNHSVIDLPTCGYSDAFIKRFIKKKPIDDMLENDFPDPWYISSHIVIASDHLPWLQSPPPPVPGTRAPRRQLRASKSSQTRSSRTNRPTRPLPPLPASPTTPTDIPTLPSSSRPVSTASRSNSSRQKTDDVMQWMDLRLSQRSFSRSSPTATIVQPPPKNTTRSRAPSTTVRSRRSSSLSSDVSRVLASLPAADTGSAATLVAGRRGSNCSVRKAKNKFDAAEWPQILSQGDEEQDRMVAQHYILRTALKGDFAAPMRSNLEKGAVVLDVGCGPGTWSMEMATEFPRSTFIGIDRASNFPRDIKPKNCFFRTASISQLPLPFPDNSVDYIFQRDLNWDLQAHQWSPLVREYLRILKPGGWIELVEPDLETQSSRSQECAMNDKLLYGISMRHQDPYVARHLSSILAANGFRRVESQFQSLPLGWTNEDDIGSLPLARAASSHHMFTLQSLQPWLSVVMGLSSERYNNYIADLPAEWKRGQTYINWHCAVAQKPPTAVQ